MGTEAKARIKINKLLEESGWRLLDEGLFKANVILEGHTRMEDLGDDFEKTKSGFMDYLLVDEKNFPLCVLEAKAEEKDPLFGKEQAREYAESQKARFVILSNGNLHYFWDLEKGNPTVISSFPSLESITHRNSFTPNTNKLADLVVDENYIAETQLPDFNLDPRFQNQAAQSEYLREKGLKLLRPYQIKAVHRLQEEARKGRDRFLFEMATGTGKTLVSAAVIKLFLKSGNASRILFLVDRLELEDQAYKNFVRYLKNDYTCMIYKQKREDWRKAEIVVSTVQSLSFNNKYKKLFSPTDFDLIISDEAHRSISGNSRAVFEYFVGYKLGLTATPKDYLKNVDPEKLSARDVRAWERRQLLDTYKTFGCEGSEPTFRYSLLDGVNNGYLVNPVLVDARTEITTQLLSDQGYSVVHDDDKEGEEEQTYFGRDFEKKFFSDRTNRIFCKTFIENALKDPMSQEIGKTIVFCVSQKHAARVTQILNEFAHQLWPEKYNSDFAIQVTSSVKESQRFTINFVNNNLSGHSRFLEGYKTSKTRVCVTVGMMTTGYDCEDILNVCLMRPIFSPSDFIQIKGRGTRKFLFSLLDNTQDSVDKNKFKLFDFFANCEFFEEKYNYDEVLELPPVSSGDGNGGGGEVINETYDSVVPDPLKTLDEKNIGPEGMKVDHKFFERFESKIKDDPIIKESMDRGDVETAEEHIKTEVFDKPKEFFNLPKLRRSLQVDRRVSLKEILEKIFGLIPGFKNKDELLNEEFEKFILIYHPEYKYVNVSRNYFKAYVTDADFRNIVDNKDFVQLNTYPGFSMREFQELNGWRDTVPEYIKDYVSLNKFM